MYVCMHVCVLQKRMSKTSDCKSTKNKKTISNSLKCFV